MDRRATLATLLGRKPGRSLNSGLEPYEGPWEYEQAAHLLRRSMFGPTNLQIKEALNLGLDATIDLLFQELPLPEPPVNPRFEDDPNVPIGATWIDAPYSQTVNFVGYRTNSLVSWTIGNILQEGISIREKLTLFWNNHFATSNVPDPKFMYRHNQLLRANAWGNFKQLIKDVTIDPNMLRFLNGNQNTRVAPNENYARELLELYTIGKGPQTDEPGDYTNYTEQDVIEIAKVLTGWRDTGFRAINPDIEVGSFFRPNAHDTSTKTLSHRFDNVEISDMGENEYAHLIDIIFQKEEVARFICRKLYRWFIYYVIDDNAEVNVIEPMAQILIDNDYEIKPVLEALLKSEHFFDILYVGPMIKNPMDFAVGILKQFEVALPEALNPKYRIWANIYGLLGLMQMEYYNPPSVAGWKAYYQEPLFYRTWISAATLKVRMDYTNVLATFGFVVGGQNISIDVLELITTLDNPYDPNAVVAELASFVMPQALTDGQLAALKEVLIPGLPDFEWTVEYGEYAADPENSDLALSVELKLRTLVRSIVSMAEYYLS